MLMCETLLNASFSRTVVLVAEADFIHLSEQSLKKQFEWAFVPLQAAQEHLLRDF